MFPLHCKVFPATAPDLRDALEESLRQAVRPAAEMVTVEERQYPKLASIQVSLDGAHVSERPPPRPAPPVGEIQPGLQVENFAISGRPILLQGAKVELSCTAREVRVGQGRDAEGNVLLLLQDSAEGKVEVALALSDLEALLLAGAKAGAAKHGVTVEEVRIELEARSECALDVVVQVRAKKLFLSGAVRMSGSVAIDEQLLARFSDWECVGDGTLGTLACGFIAPRLAQFNRREFSLMALPLGEVKLRDIRIVAGRELRVMAHFGGVA
jgi:hypothetical protein